MPVFMPLTMPLPVLVGMPVPIFIPAPVPAFMPMRMPEHVHVRVVVLVPVTVPLLPGAVPSAAGAGGSPVPWLLCSLAAAAPQDRAASTHAAAAGERGEGLLTRSPLRTLLLAVSLISACIHCVGQQLRFVVFSQIHALHTHAPCTYFKRCTSLV